MRLIEACKQIQTAFRDDPHPLAGFARGLAFQVQEAASMAVVVQDDPPCPACTVTDWETEYCRACLRYWTYIALDVYVGQSGLAYGAEPIEPPGGQHFVPQPEARKSK